MSKITYGNALRLLREKNKMSVKYVIEELKKFDICITDKTLYSYENDKRAATADTFLALCQIYKCENILGTFAGIEPDYSIPTDDEWKLIEKYRSLDTPGQNHVDAVIKWEKDRTQNIEGLTRQISGRDSRIAELKKKLSMASPSESYLNAAHADDNATDEDRQMDDAMMADDSEWE